MNKAHLLTRWLLAAVMSAPLVVAACGGGTAIRESMDDASITTRVKTALLNEPGVNATRVDVETAQGVVTLKGSVKSQEEEQKAVAVARRITGVRDVKSTLQITPQ
jgi:osmotically-inducible protein OsmY